MPNLNHTENVIAIVPDGTQSQRLVFIAKSGEHDLPIVLRQESYSEGVGWFAQSQIEMSRQQMIMLRSAMGGTGGASKAASSSRIISGTANQGGSSSLSRSPATNDLTPALLPFPRSIERERVGA